MTRFTTFLLCTGIVGLVIRPASGQEQSVASIVEQFYPASLDLTEGIGSRQQCFAACPSSFLEAQADHTRCAL